MVYKKWTCEEIKFLLFNVELGSKELAQYLKKSRIAIIKKSLGLGLSINRKKLIWDSSSIGKLTMMSQLNLSHKEMSNILGKSLSSIEMACFKYGIISDASKVKKRLFQEGKLIHPMKGRRNPLSANNLSRYNKENAGKSFEQKFGLNKSKDMKIALSNRMKKNNPTKNGLTQGWRNRISLASKKAWENPEYRRKMINVLQQMSKSSKTKEALKKSSDSLKIFWQDEKRRKNILDALEIRPNKPEKLLCKLIQENHLDFTYVGDASFWILRFNPDFINKEHKLIIELFGDYWHKLSKSIERDKERFLAYKNRDFKYLIIWECELKDTEKVVSKIRNFYLTNKNISNGSSSNQKDIEIEDSGQHY